MLSATAIIVALAATYVYLQSAAAAQTPTDPLEFGPSPPVWGSNDLAIVVPELTSNADLPMRWLAQQRPDEQLWSVIRGDDVHRWRQDYFKREHDQYRPDVPYYGSGRRALQRQLVPTQALPNPLAGNELVHSPPDNRVEAW